ncbi:MAG TPA: glycosyltransferase family 39 protein [Bacteroidetes bacterium]|nr:glycosyltransferase family 39 protein [Bacteroidota bacterium]
MAIVAKISEFLFGNSTFAVRIFPALIGAASVIVIALIVKKLGGKFWAILIACFAFIISPAFLRSNSLFQPVSFNQFYWLLTAYFVVVLIQTQNPKFWIHLFVLWGLAFLNKYSIAFLIVAFFPALLLTKDRKLILTKQFIWGAIIGFFIILPNLIWQFSHNWPVVHHMLELQRTQLVNVRIGDFFMSQLLMNIPNLLVWVFGLLFLLFFKDGKPYRILGYTFIFVILVLILLRGKPYYTLGIYTTLFAVGGFAIEKYFTNRLRLAKPLILVVMLFFSLPIIPYSLPILPFDKMIVYAEKSKQYGVEEALRWEDGRIHQLPQDYADMIGWKELGLTVAKAYHSLNEEEKSRCAIYAENYGEAGAIKYYGKKYKLPEPICFNGSFLFWAPDSLNINSLIYVNDDTSEISLYFNSVKQVGGITNIYARENGLPVFLCRGPRNNFEEFYRNKVRKLKSNYR